MRIPGSAWNTAIIAILGFASAGLADEGMWLFNQPPTKLLKEKYGFEPDARWYEHVQKSCVRFGRGGSASLIKRGSSASTYRPVSRSLPSG